MLDRNACDEIARRITAHDPPPQFVADVLDRIAERRRPDWMRWLVPVTAVAVIAAAGIFIRTSRPASDDQIATSQQVAAPSPAVAASTAAAAPAGDASVQPVADVPPLDNARDRRPVRFRAVTVAVSPEEAAWLARAVPALAPPDALELGSIQPERLTIPQLEMKPLVTAPITFAQSTTAGGGF